MTPATSVEQECLILLLDMDFLSLDDGLSSWIDETEHGGVDGAGQSVTASGEGTCGGLV